MIEDSYILISLYRITKELNRETSRISERHGLTLGQFAVLEALYHKGDLTVGEVKEAILSSDGTAPVIIENLVKQQLVTKSRDPEDGRRSIVRLTRKGKKRIEEVMPENTDMFTDRFSVWSLQEKKMLSELLEKYRKQRKRNAAER